MADEDLLEKAFAEGEEAPRLASGNRVVPPQLLSKLRHDMRTPIHQILGYAEMVEEDAIATGQTGCAADLGKIQDAARRLLEMVDTLQERLLPAVDEAALPEPAHDELPATGLDPGPGPRVDVPPVTGPIRRADLDIPVAEPVEPAHLLVVDDNAENRDMLSRRLRAHGFTIAVAENGPEALRLLEEVPFDLVLLDVVMPGMSGLEVLRDLRGRHDAADLPVIMATARDDSNDVVTALRLGANDYVTKPLDFPVVLARVGTQLSLARAKARIGTLARDLEVRNRFIFETFGRYLSNEVVERLLQTPEGLKLGGETRKVTLLMSDLRGFTQVADRIPPDRVVRLLNNYLGTMADLLLSFQGTIDEFIGDAILAIFGAPVQREDDALRAVACAVEMQKAMERVNEFNRREGLPPVEMGIAIHTGEVVVGNIGSDRRAKYGVVGSPVNLTARIESYTVGGQILVSERTRREGGGQLSVGSEVVVQMKGFENPVSAWDVRGVAGGYDLFLPARDEPLHALRGPLAVRFATISGKRVDGPESEGLLVRLSMKEAEVETRERPDPFRNLRLRFVGNDGRTIPGELYGKVSPPRAGTKGFGLRFTSVPPEIRSFLETVLAGSR
ncbi:MAG TPA: adenylate/guanylate cyclase domain-containing protein [Thermoanaerobaculia bacterium]|jgi:class 3 adenylate cyclase|nr:adenylate/guanylate cyclase domain-containing protein [Thermoanaerobaculia bacterium]HQP87459.1 adenylate/guanylate cyclase domain-containing protein [Thermoanaerobaculia bacterium]